MKDLIIALIMALLVTAIAVLLIILGNAGNSYNKGFEAGKAYTPPVMQRVDSLTIPEFTPAERRIITQFMIIIKRAAEVKE